MVCGTNWRGMGTLMQIGLIWNWALLQKIPTWLECPLFGFLATLTMSWG
jgi:hypothetical protein